MSKKRLLSMYLNGLCGLVNTRGVVFSEVPVDYLKWCYKNGVIKNERVEGYLEELFGE